MVTYQWLAPSNIFRTDVEDINQLLRQLTDSPRLLGLLDVITIARESQWIVARDGNGRIKGMSTLTVSRIPTGRVGHIDDVVVDDSLRGQGVGRALVEALLDRARSQDLVDLFKLSCNPSRVTANRLYVKLGFRQHDTTNHYILKI
jgi:ribosomal protein S18 acetylase RimI-like enzyme